MVQANPERFHSQCWACARPSMSGKIDWDAPCLWGPWNEMLPEKLLPRHWPKRLCVYVCRRRCAVWPVWTVAGLLCGAVGDAAQGNIVSYGSQD
eukprot:5015693-Prymnesium_polylepis.1